MPEFILNRDNRGSHPFYALDDFAKGYVEAMFFTNGDTGDDDDNRLNDLGVERLTRAAVAEIESDCATFLNMTLPGAKVSIRETLDLLDSEREYSLQRAGNDFWYTRQGHGVGYWDRAELEPRDAWEELGSPRVDDPTWKRWEDIRAGSIGNRLTEAAKTFGESYVEISRGWIYVR